MTDKFKTDVPVPEILVGSVWLSSSSKRIVCDSSLDVEQARALRDYLNDTGGGEVSEHRIGYLSETGKDYCNGLAEQDTLERLQRHVKDFQKIAADAQKIVRKMTDSEFKDWRAGLKLERRGKFAGEAWAMKYGAVLMPAVVIEVGLIAQNYHVPFGVAYIRMREVGRIVEDKRGIAKIVPIKETP